jgi:hypothetical protein
MNVIGARLARALFGVAILIGAAAFFVMFHATKGQDRWKP